MFLTTAGTVSLILNISMMVIGFFVAKFLHLELLNKDVYHWNVVYKMEHWLFLLELNYLVKHDHMVPTSICSNNDGNFSYFCFFKKKLNYKF